jgi:hypothetical protein
MNEQQQTVDVKIPFPLPQVGCWTYGCVIAIVVSYVENHSIFWAAFDGIFSWLYLICHILAK